MSAGASGLPLLKADVSPTALKQKSVNLFAELMC